MHLTRVTGTNVHAASQAGASGDADLLALLLGAEGATPPTFPLTLEAALAGSDAAALAGSDAAALAGDAAALAGQAAADDSLVDGGEDPAILSADAGALTIEAALAAALALAGAVTPEPEVSTTAADDGRAAVVVEAATTIAASVSSLPTEGAAGTAALASAEAPSAAPAPANETAPTDPQPAAPELASNQPANSAAAKTVAPEASATMAATHAPLTTTADDGARKTPADRIPTGAAAQGTAAAGDQHARAATDADAPPSFEHRDGEGHDAEPGTFERPAAAVGAESPAKLALTVTTPGAPGETMHLTRSETLDGGAAAPLPPATTTGTTTHASGTSAERTALAGTIEPRWGERVADAVRLSALRGGGEMRLQLEPEGLGHIDVRLDLHADGVRAVIVTEHESTRALLQSQQHVLHEAFGRSDLRLSGFSVDVGSGGATSFQWNGEGGEGDRAPAPPTAAPLLGANGADASESASTPLANGRVSVRV